MSVLGKEPQVDIDIIDRPFSNNENRKVDMCLEKWRETSYKEKKSILKERFQVG